MRKSRIWLIVVSAVLLAISAGVTVALLTSSSYTVKNTFTAGEVSITLKETTGSEYKMTPGATVKKDPVVTVKAGSEDCWLFVKIEKSSNFDTYCSFAVSDGWTSLAGHGDVYYRKVEKSETDVAFQILKDDSFSVRDTVTEELLNAVTVNPTLSFTAYAAQSDVLETAHDAWRILEQ